MIDTIIALGLIVVIVLAILVLMIALWTLIGDFWDDHKPVHRAGHYDPSRTRNLPVRKKGGQ